MLHTPFCELVGVEHPIVAAPFGPWDEVALAAAVCQAGALGSLGTAARPVADLQRQWRQLRELTDRPFAVNHTLRPLDEKAFAATLDARPAVISFHMGVPADLIARARDRGIRWMQQVVDVAQAEAALAAGADVLIAQGGEAGGHCGSIATLVLVPQVVALAGDTPVLAAGGVAGGAGLAAALALGAQGVAMGTRFLASDEMAVARTWKERIVAARADEAVKTVNLDRVFPPLSRPAPALEPRSLPTPLLDQLARDPDSVDPAVVVPQVLGAILAGGGDEYVAFTGQSAGLIDDILPAAEIVARTVAEAERALAATARYRTAEITR